MLFIEEPVIGDVSGSDSGSASASASASASDRLDITSPQSNLWVVQPVLAPGPDVERRTRSLIRDAAERLFRSQFEAALHWLYTPMMEPQIDLFPQPRAIVYDCMDELSRFAMAPAGLAERERTLLARADLVFAGGYELGEAKSRVHPNVHVFGCGVDFDHFQKAAEVTPASELAMLRRPVLGYVGVIDERLDYGLLKELAQKLPDATIAMIGPTAKVDPRALPREPNIVYLGPRLYERLPEYLAGFDVCLMPFAMNEASYYINPTKTLEYLATGKPVLSTPVRDVVRQFRDVVHVADRSRFVETARTVLAGVRLDPHAGIERARSASWDKTVAAMELYAALACSLKPAHDARTAPARRAAATIPA